MPRESRDKPNALNQALEEFLTAEQARPAPAPKPASGAAAGAPAAPGGTTRLPANAVHRASKPQEAGQAHGDASAGPRPHVPAGRSG